MLQVLCSHCSKAQVKRIFIRHLHFLRIRSIVPFQLTKVELPGGFWFTEVHSVSSLQGLFSEDNVVFTGPTVVV